MNSENTKNLLLILLKDLVLFGLIGFSIFTIFITNLYIKINKLNHERIKVQDQYIFIIENDNSEVQIDYKNFPNYLNDYVNCLNNGVKVDYFSQDLKNNINDLKKFTNKYQKKLQYSYKDINTGFHIGFNENTKIFAASTTKAPLAIYTYKLADEKKLDLNKKYTYTSNYYANGTGIIKNQKVNTSYTLRDLTKYSIMYSDNIAYLMISDIVSKKDTSKYFSNLGAKNLFNSKKMDNLYQLFGELSAADGNIYMIDLYKYSLNNSKNSNELLSYFKKASLNNVKIATKKQVAHKYGWTDKYVNDMALVYDENPYVITITSTLGNDDWSSIFQKIAKKIDKIHVQYIKETKQYCNNYLK